MDDLITIDCYQCKKDIYLNEWPDDIELMLFCSWLCEAKYAGPIWWVISKSITVLYYLLLIALGLLVLAVLFNLSTHALLVVIVILLLLK